jgi:hypothetical protein
MVTGLEIGPASVQTGAGPLSEVVDCNSPGALELIVMLPFAWVVTESTAVARPSNSISPSCMLFAVALFLTLFTVSR